MAHSQFFSISSVYDCFQRLIVDLNSCSRDYITHKTKNIYILTLYWKSLQTPDLEHRRRVKLGNNDFSLSHYLKIHIFKVDKHRTKSSLLKYLDTFSVVLHLFLGQIKNIARLVLSVFFRAIPQFWRVITSYSLPLTCSVSVWPFTCSEEFVVLGRGLIVILIMYSETGFGGRAFYSQNNTVRIGDFQKIRWIRWLSLIPRSVSHYWSLLKPEYLG